MHKRKSTLPIRKYLVDNHPTCIGCGVTVNPGLSYTGSIAMGVYFHKTEATEKREIGNVHGVNNSMAPMTQVTVTRTIPIVQRKKGLICTDCAANYHTFTDSKGVQHPIVITDPRPGFDEVIAGHGLRADKAESGDKASRKRKSLLDPRE